MKRSFLLMGIAGVLSLMGAFGGASVYATEYRPLTWETGGSQAAVLRIAEGMRRVRVQVRASAGDPWQVVGLTHLPGTAGTLKVRLPGATAPENILVEASTSDPFPYSYYEGQTSFARPSSGPTVPGRDGLNAGMAEDGAGETAPTATAVEESDIWKWRERTLYYFNTLRGLQAFDLADAANPKRLASLRLPAVGEDMYLVSADHVALLVNRFDYTTGAEESEVRVVRHVGSVLEEVARVPVKGRFVESRLVGSTLCVVTQWVESSPTPDAESFTYQSKSRVLAVDLSQPDRPVTRGTVEIPNADGAWSSSTVLHATADWLFVAQDSWLPQIGSRSFVHAIDLRGSDQPLAIGATFPLAGQLLSKFHLRYDADGILTTVTQADGGVVETWDVPMAVLSTQPGPPRPLDSLVVGRGERLFGTRFDGERVHVVTFRVIDPLFCVDLGDPRDLRLLGELEVPGFSTYLEAFADGTRLLSLGVEDSRVAVSLFDVKDPAKPGLVARLRFGDPQHWSWSEGNYDDKAIGFFRDQGLMVFPLSVWSPDHGYRQGMQLVDATATGLQERGFVAHRFNARRARLLDDALVSISGSELIIVDVADRDEPKPLATLDIAWSVDHVLVYGDALAQFESGDGYQSPGGSPAAREARLRMSSKDDPDAPIAQLDLASAGQVTGVARRGSLAYVLLDLTEHREVPDPADPKLTQWQSARVLTTVIIDLTDPAAPRRIGSARSEKVDASWSYGAGEMEAHWLPGGQLLWFPPETTGNYWYRCFACGIGGGLLAPGMMMDIAMPWWGGGSDEFLVVDVATPDQPSVVVRELLIPETENAGSGRAFVSGDARLLASWTGWQSTETGWTEETWVQAIDLSTPSTPQRGPLASLPGPLQGLHQTTTGGTILFTLRPEMVTTPEKPPTWTGHALVEALAYDGLSAFRLDGIRAEYSAHFSAVVSGPHVLLPRPRLDSPTPSGPALHVLSWNSTTGMFQALDPLPLDIDYPSLAAQDGFVIVRGGTVIEMIAAHQLPATPARRRFDLGIPSWSANQLAINLPASEAWHTSGAYGVDRLDLAGLPFPPSPLRRAPRDQAAPEWTAISLSPLDLVPATASAFPGPLAPDTDFAFLADEAAETFDAWSQRLFGEVVDPWADHDGDDFEAYAEWAFGSSPLNPQSTPQPQVVLMQEPGASPQIVLVAHFNPLTQLDDCGICSGLNITPWSSTDLRSWKPLTLEEYEIIDDVGRRTLILPPPPASAEADFARLSLSFTIEG